jgi:hypothetical protein
VISPSSTSLSINYTRHIAASSWYTCHPATSHPSFVRQINNTSNLPSIWGLTHSPAHSLLATVCSSQPAAALEFVTPAAATCNLYFSFHPQRPLVDFERLSTEALVFEAMYGDHDVDFGEYPYRRVGGQAREMLGHKVQQRCVFCTKEVRWVNEESSICVDGHAFGLCLSSNVLGVCADGNTCSKLRCYISSRPRPKPDTLLWNMRVQMPEAC